MTALSTLSTSRTLPATSWGLIPPLGHLDAYISAVNRMPMLTLEQEQTFAR
ncbi:MAG: RNA polymerase sigma factor RpoH, partial [Betaproteobacteria bacterium]